MGFLVGNASEILSGVSSGEQTGCVSASLAGVVIFFFVETGERSILSQGAWTRCSGEASLRR